MNTCDAPEVMTVIECLGCRAVATPGDINRGGTGFVPDGDLWAHWCDPYHAADAVLRHDYPKKDYHWSAKE